jgi:multiple sugar transport system substrate-binding protein
MASFEVQKTLALEHSLLPVRTDLYTDEYTSQATHLRLFKDVLPKTRTRPATPQYSSLSQIIYTACNGALKRKQTPTAALDAAQEKIDSTLDQT